jgi:hypothetical protein
MARLNELAVRTAKPGRYADGDGLIFVSKSGAKTLLAGEHKV